LEAHSVERKLAAIFAADVEGYSRLMGLDEVGTLRTLTAYRVIIDRLIASHRGRIFNTAGDSVLADFASAVDAVQCAVEVQEAIAAENSSRRTGEHMRFRIGVHVGDIMVHGDNLFGDAVNVAARLEALAEPGRICVSRVVRDQIRDRLPYTFVDMGEQSVKNIARPVRVYGISVAAVATSPPISVSTHDNRPATPPKTPRLSIVVLPFANLSNDPEQEYFADGITDDLTTDLSRISGSFVISRNTAFTYKGKSVDVKQVGRELGVRVHQGDIVVDDGDIFGDGMNIAARLEGLAEPGGICVSARVQEDVAGRLNLTFDDIREQSLKNIARPVRVYRVWVATAEKTPKVTPTESGPALTLPDKPSIAVLPFANMSDDPEQEYFADGMVEEIITALSRIRWLFVIARNSSFTYKARSVDVEQVGRELGVQKSRKLL